MDNEAVDDLDDEEPIDDSNEIIEDTKPEPTNLFNKSTNLGALNLDPGAGFNPNTTSITKLR